VIIIDTSVFSELMRSTPDEGVLRWLDAQRADEVWTTAVTVLEVRFGLDRLAAGRRRRDLEHAFATVLDEDLARRVLAFDRAAAERTIVMLAETERAGRTMELRDAQIAGIALANRATIATRNTPHFQITGVGLIDPFGGP
jgi:predicted nucleic acid-binding protein